MIPRISFRRIIFSLYALFVIAACTPTPSFKSTDISGVPWGGDFTLTAHTGKPVKISDFSGKVVVLFFGYTHCPDVCAPTLAKLDQALKRLGESADQVQVLFVTIDPAHDTVAQLAGFVPKFNPSFIGLTGSEAQIAAVAADYKVAYAKNPQAKPGEILVDHATGILVKDKKGKVRLLVKNEISVDDLVSDLRVLAREKS